MKDKILGVLSLFSSSMARKLYEERVAREGLTEEDQMLVLWTTFFRRNPHIFVEYYLGLDLHLYQKIMIYMMFKSDLVVLLCARNIGKSYITAVFAVSYCILFPNAKVLLGSFTKGQAGLMVSEKIEKELMISCPILKDEIYKVSNNQNSIGVRFYNGSNIFAVCVGESARGFRSSCMVVDEFRLVKEEYVTSIIQPTMQIRVVPCLFKPEYEFIKELKEEPKEVYLSSAWWKSNWYYKVCKDAIMDMYKGKALFFSTDYALCLKF